MLSKKLLISKCVTRAFVKLKIMRSTRIQKKSQEVTHSTRNSSILKSPELEFLSNSVSIIMYFNVGTSTSIEKLSLAELPLASSFNC